MSIDSTDDPDGSAPYLQIAAALRTRITSGALTPGARLPSQHQLAAEHGVARATVQSALRVLRGEGLIQSRQGAGNFVRNRPAPISTAPPHRCLARIELDEPQLHWLRDLPGAAHQVEQHSYCAIEGGHPGPHAALGQQAGKTEWWIRWTLSASEIVEYTVCPAETAERHKFDPTEPADFCLLYSGHPGRHSYEWGEPAPW